jgi:Na+/H+ antiporter NhaC
MSSSTPPAANPAPQTGVAATGALNKLSVAALVVGIVSCTFILSFYGIPGLVALIFGLVSRSQIKRTGQRGRGFALAGIILGIVGILIGIATIILAAVLAQQLRTQNGVN